MTTRLSYNIIHFIVDIIHQSALTLPYPEGHLEVLPAPARHLLVVGAQLPVVRAVDGEQATRHRWRPNIGDISDI